jgi:hypothetical protein
LLARRDGRIFGVGTVNIERWRHCERALWRG